MALLFLGAMLMLWRWISHAISRPLKVLSLETRQASLKGTLLEKMQSGPAEIVDLSASFSTLLECMEARVRERTKHLADANRELNIARLQAEAASEAKSDFLTNVSHELRTPLASIRASAEILNTYPDEATEVRLEFAEVIQLEAERLSRLIENVLDLGKIESGRLDWNLEQVQIADTLFEVVRAANIDAGGAGIAVTLDVQGELPKTLADRDRLLQLWTNLVGNAVKFSSRGSAVEVVAFRRGSSIVVEVRDEGPGIREADQSIIFERFSQVTEDTLTDKPHGTGLGLAIAKEIADHHQATIQVESEWSVGSTFRVVLPVVSEAELEAVDVN
jgi:signal transduction histidine kinase